MDVVKADNKFEDFSAGEYANFLFKNGATHISEFLLEHLARFYSSLPPCDGGLKILDYGCGPSLPYSISAAAKASEIVLADYAKPNREHLQKWLDGGDSAYDWTPHFQYVVQTLEGGTEEDAKQRQHLLRSRVRAVVSCDFNSDDFLDEHYRGEYDVIMCFLCLDNAANLNDYKSGLAKISSQLKEGGHFLLYSTRRENCDVGFYIVNGIKYSNVALKRDFILRVLEEAGLIIDIEDYLPLTPNPFSNCEGAIFLCARKVHTKKH